MDISSLPNNIENLLKAKVSEGIFDTLEDAISFAVQVAFIDNNISKENIENLNSEIEKGWQEMQAGKGRSSEEVFKDLRKKYA